MESYDLYFSVIEFSSKPQKPDTVGKDGTLMSLELTFSQCSLTLDVTPILICCYSKMPKELNSL